MMWRQARQVTIATEFYTFHSLLAASRIRQDQHRQGPISVLFKN